MSDLVLSERPAPGVVVLTLNRPAKKNAISRALLLDLSDAIKDAAAAGETRAIVLTGADPAFCAGVDLAGIAAGDDFPAEAIHTFRHTPVPLIGAVNGAAITGGLELCLACDFRIGSERASFADTHARLGFTPAWGMSTRLPEAVGQAWARQISLAGTVVDAPTALRIGLLNELLPHEQLLPRAIELASAIAATSAAPSGEVRALFDLTRDQFGDAADRREQALAAGLIASLRDRG
ncbi:enoyl-CoA hydratase [Jatrophihabitans sp. GAS493]|uniref:enoyl-CoA hydratase-related protein n=1 Tax=Jatrophihabitans sp. GAS493 TaxID=1907575 RepID=UPI000BB85FFF|nr:enoyl-CoA hydratase-related protein [Jatrophihabitans sp. GAS493]SOD72131.1 enoyl-CoA hydratase [Jatrophihabitans sp. GAS493]